MKEKNVERDWITAAGLRAVVLMHSSLGHRCGYVAVGPEHPLFNVEYSEQTDALNPVADDEPVGGRSPILLLCGTTERLARPSPEYAFDVHGGITYSGGGGKYPVAGAGLWWFGYDCGHAGDLPDPNSDYGRRCAGFGESGQHRTLDYCVAECERLAAQLIGPKVRGFSAPEARAEATPASRTPVDHSPTQDATEGQSETSFGDAK